MSSRFAAFLAASSGAAVSFDDLAGSVVSDSVASCAASGLSSLAGIRPGRRVLVWVRDLDGTKIGVVT